MRAEVKGHIVQQNMQTEGPELSLASSLVHNTDYAISPQNSWGKHNMAYTNQ